jgi:hypothetical protein
MEALQYFGLSAQGSNGCCPTGLVRIATSETGFFLMSPPPRRSFWVEAVHTPYDLRNINPR